MLHKSVLSFALAMTAVLALAPATMAQDQVTGDFELDWNACWAGPGDEVPDWVGTVDIDGTAYDMVFFNLGDGSPPGHDRDGSFIEIWAIYDGLQLDFDADCAAVTYAGDLAMWGHDAGISDFEAKSYSMTGSVVEGFGDYADLTGESVAMQGTFTLDPDGNPLTAPGVIEIG